MTSPGRIEPTPGSSSPSSCLAAVAVLAIALGLAILALPFLLPGVQGPLGPGPQRHPGVGHALQKLRLRPLTGQGQPLTLGDLSGQVVVLNFWGTWCPPCLQELPDIVEIEKAFRDHPQFRLLAVSCGNEMPEDADRLRASTAALLEDRDIDMPTFADPGLVTRQAVHQAVGFQGYPTTLILDRRGVVRGVWVGPATKSEMEALITQLLEEG